MASVAVVGVWSIALGSVSAFGYGRWSDFKPFGLPALEFFDASMNVLTPVVAALICVFAGWVLRPKRILAECRRDGSAVGFKLFYVVMVKFIAPLLVLAILVSEVCRIFGVDGWSI
jgi:NSS family neurotransmitter:Na+ symporter